MNEIDFAPKHTENAGFSPLGLLAFSEDSSLGLLVSSGHSSSLLCLSLSSLLCLSLLLDTLHQADLEEGWKVRSGTLIEHNLGESQISQEDAFAVVGKVLGP